MMKIDFNKNKYKKINFIFLYLFFGKKIVIFKLCFKF